MVLIGLLVFWTVVHIKISKSKILLVFEARIQLNLSAGTSISNMIILLKYRKLSTAVPAWAISMHEWKLETVGRSRNMAKKELRRNSRPQILFLVVGLAE